MFDAATCDEVQSVRQQNINILIDHNRAFPAKFEANGREILGGGGCDDAADLPVASVPFECK